MLLTGKVFSGRAVMLLTLAALPLLAAACQPPVRYDDAFSRKGARKQPAVPVHDPETVLPAEGPETAAWGEAHRADAENGDPARAIPAVFGLRSDGTVRHSREERCSRRDRTEPAARPSYRDLRQARATAFAEADMAARGGNTYVTSAGASSNPAQVKFTAAPGALGIRLEASAMLNAVDGRPTALFLVIFHLSDRGPLDRLAQTAEGMRRILYGEMFDASVKAVRHIEVQPGMSAVLELERAEGGRYVAVAAGYNRPDARSCLAVTQYNIGEYKKLGETSFHRSVSMFAPQPLNLDIVLGDTAMTVSGGPRVYHNLRDSTRLLRRQPHYFEEASINSFFR